ncbi:ribosome-inactivating family protein [Kitasatospora sp. NPDC001309]
MIRQLRELSGTSIAPALARTTTATGRYIEISVNDYSDPINTHRLSLYLRLDNLYLDGFTASGRNWRFSDAPTYLSTRFAAAYPRDGLLENLRYSSHYSDLASPEARGAQRYSGAAFYGFLSTLFGVSEGSRDQARAPLAAMIGATSEAARFGWIENRIAASIETGGQQDGAQRYDNLGPFGAGLENSWDELSRLVYREQNGDSQRPTVRIDGRNYSSISDIVNGIGTGTPRIAPFLTHGTAH